MAGYQKARTDWISYGSPGQTLIRQGDLDQWEQAIYDLKYLTYNVKDYGAVGDGSADDTVAIQAALDAGAGDVFLPAGTYKVTSTLTVPYGANGKRIRGAGAGLTGAAATTISWSGGAAYVFNIGGNTAGNFTRWQALEDLEIVGNASAFGAVQFRGSRWSSIRRCYIRDFTTAGAVGVILEGNASTLIANYFNTIEQCFVDNCPYGIYLRGETTGTGANSNVIQNCSISNCTTAGVMIDGGDTNRVLLCEFDSNGMGVTITGANTAAIYNTVAFSQFDSGGAVQVLNAAAASNRILYNTGSAFGINSDTGTDTNVEGDVGIPVPSIASAATITLSGGSLFSVTGTTNITSVAASWANRRVTLKFAGALTFTDGSNLKLAGNFVTTADDTITLVCDGTNWYETARSVN